MKMSIITCNTTNILFVTLSHAGQPSIQFTRKNHLKDFIQSHMWLHFLVRCYLYIMAS